MDQLRPTRETAEVINAAFASLQRIGREAVDLAAANLTLGPEGKHTAATRHVEACARQIHAILQPRHSTFEPEKPPLSIQLRGKKGPVPPTPAPAEDDEDENQNASDNDTEDDDNKAPTVPLQELDPGDEDFDEGGDAAPIAESLQQEQEDDDDEESPSPQRTREVNLKPFDPHSDSDHHIAELRVSITRHGNKNQAIGHEFSGAMEEMVLRFRWAAKFLPAAKHTITRIIKFLEAAIYLIKSGSSFFDTMEAVDFDDIAQACRIMRSCGQKQESIEDLIMPHTDIEASDDTIGSMEEAHSTQRRWDTEDLDCTISRQMDDNSRAKRAQLANINRVLSYNAINMIISYSLFDGIEGIIADHPDEEEIEQLKEWYVVAARQASRKLDPRTKRNGTEVLHSNPADIEGFLKALEQGELPKNLWRQQNEPIEACASALRSGHRDVLLEMPPGAGKTIVAAVLAHRLGHNGNVLYLAPSGAVCEQDRLAYEQIAGHKDTGIIAGNRAVLDQQATFSTYTSITKYAELNMFPPDKYSIIVYDEAHRSLSEKRQAIRERFPNAIIIACSASGTDIGGKNLADEFTPVYKIDFLDGIRAGIVNPIRLKRIGIPAYTSTDMSSAILQECREQGVGRKGEQAIVMMARLAKVRDIHEYLSRSGMKSRIIEGTMPLGMAHDIERRFRAGEGSVLNLCKSLYEGWDHPPLKRLFMGCDEFGRDWELRQRVGRIVRVVPGKGDSTMFELVDQARLDLAAEAAARGEHFQISGLDTLFALDQNPNFQNGDRIAEPIPGFWPEHARLI